MLNNIDLSKYNVHTDLAIDDINLLNEHIKTIEEINDNVKVTKINLDDIESKKINKKKGIYTTIEFKDITDFQNREIVGKTLQTEIEKILKYKNIDKMDSGLIVGLGNPKSTPDALGSLTINNILVTRHLFLLNTKVKKGIKNISAFTPGVMGETGIETKDLIESIINIVKPSFLIVIDSLKASSVDRVNKTIQITDTGIHPGSGVGNTRKEISEQTLKIPVIAIGVPTVVDVSTIVSDTIDMLLNHLSYIKSNFAKNKLIVKQFSNYKDKIKNSNNLTEEEKKYLLGALGELDEDKKRALFEEVLNRFNYNLIVTPKEIDYLIEKLSDIISSALNNALHPSINNY